MRLKGGLKKMFKFKKIASILTTTLVLGATVHMAAAVSYPMPFVSGSSSSAAVVYGGPGIALTDVVAASDIRADLAARLINPGSSTGGTTTVVEGEAYELFTSSTPLYLNSSINSVRSILTDSELPTLLGDSDFSGNVDAEVTHTIKLNSNPTVSFAKQPDSSNDDPAIGVSLGTTSSNYIYNMTVTFDTAVAFNNTDSEGEILEIFGQKFTVGADTSNTEIVLLRTSQTIDLDKESNPTTTVTIDEKEYTVELVLAEDTQARIKVTDSNGKTDSEDINENDSKKILGLEITVENANEAENGAQTATISVGSANDRLVLQDGSEVEIGSSGDTIEDTNVEITTNIGQVTEITIQVWTDNDKDAILVGESFIDPVFGGFKIDFSGLSVPSDFESTKRETIEVKNAGDDQMSVMFRPQYSTEAKSIDWYNNQTAAVLANDDQDLIRVREGAVINESVFAVVGNEEDGRFIELSTFNNVSSGYDNDKIEFTDVFTGNKYSTTITSEGVGTVSIGGNSYGVTYVDSTTDGAQYVTLNYPDSSGGGVVVYPTIETSKGGLLGFYEPLTITLDDYDNAGTDASALLFPDGDGLTTVTISSLGAALGGAAGTTGSFNVTCGGTTVALNASGVTSRTCAIGALTYNVTYSAANTTQIFLHDLDGDGRISNPALVFFEEQEDATDAYQALIVQITGAGTSASEVEVNEVDSSLYLGSALTLESNDDLAQSMTKWGTIVQTNDNEAGGSDQKTALISYPEAQVEAMIYIAESEATISGGSSGVSTPGEAGNILMVTDSETSSVSGKNWVVVGGSCINTAAAQLLGSSTPLCGADFTAATGVGAGQFLIQTFERTDGTFATLVAGYNAGDTTNAATYLRTQPVMTDADKKYIGTSATNAELQETTTTTP
jgi:hypothetical protein